MENIQPWCVSRQLWWGHRIPAWYGPSFSGDTLDYTAPTVFVWDTDPVYGELAAPALEYYRGAFGERQGFAVGLHDDQAAAMEGARLDAAEMPGHRVAHLWRDPDVLDTWFSSALWPFATLGWPDAYPLPKGEGQREAQGEGGAIPGESAPSLSPLGAASRPSPAFAGEGGLLAKHYPNTTLVTGFDIIFFWVARMQMMGHHMMGAAPFHTVYCHGLVRDSKGQKMSKSKGNAVDPLGLIDKYGADALRFFMAAMETQGRDIKMSEARVEGYRNFATKLWNAARFAQSNGIGGSAHLEPPRARETVNAWILSETVGCIHAVELALGEYRFDAAASAIYQFVWSRFCDWYLELVKPILAAPGAAADETRAVAGWVLDQILVILHPFMPFITEELWHALMPGRAHDLILAKWPMADARAIDREAPKAIDFLIRVIEAIRSARNELNVPHNASLPLRITDASPQAEGWLNAFAPALARLARVSNIRVGPVPETGGVAQIVLPEATLLIPLAGVIDFTVERARLGKNRDTALKEAAALTGRLANAGFLAKAAPEAVEEARAKLAQLSGEAVRLAAALERLG